jgi:hypothetical protein
MLQPGPGFTPVSIPGILDLKGLPGSAPKSNPVQDEIDRAEGEWKNTGMLQDDEDKEPPKPVTLKMMEF